MCRRLGVCLSITLLLLFGAAGFAAETFKLPLELKVAGGKRDRVDATVAFAIPGAGIAGQVPRLMETTGGRESPVAAQLDAQGGKLWWIAGGKTPAGSKRTYRLETGSAAAFPEVQVVDSDNAIEARFNDKPLLQYNKVHVEPAAGVNPKYGRSAHLHPVRTPSGAVVTDELPPDHLHQSGIFLAFTKTEFEGHEVDFWNLGGGKGRVRFKNVKSTASGPVYGSFQVEQEHVDLTGDKKLPSDPTAGKVALVETWEVRICPAGWKSGYWLLDIASTCRCASDSPLKLPEYHYGGMAIRAARPWTPQHVRFLTSEGDERIKGNHTRPRWCDVSGAIDGQMAGAIFLTHPGNFRFPEPLRIHPTMPYMVYTPSFLGDWSIEPGAPRQSRYRFVIHDGELPAETAERLWQDYAEPLMAEALSK
jgi:hypothetical protein